MLAFSSALLSWLAGRFRGRVAPRIHGELLKLGIKVSQATVAKYMVRRIGTPSPTWRSFLRNEAIDIAAIDMYQITNFAIY